MNEKKKTCPEWIGEKFMGEPVAVLCMRYWYRGRLAEVGEDFIVLTEAKAVEETGPASQAEPNQEDPIPSDILIKTMAIELICQPAWVWHGFTKGKKEKK